MSWRSMAGRSKWSLPTAAVPRRRHGLQPRRTPAGDHGQGAAAPSIWDMPSDRQIKLRDGTERPGGPDESPRPVPLCSTPTAGTLVLAGVDEGDPAAQALTVFDAATGEARLTIRGATAPLAFSRDGRRLIALDPEKGGVEARVLDPADGRELARLRGHTGPILAAAFSPDGARIVTSSRDGTVKVWDTAGRELMTLPDSRRVSPSSSRFERRRHRSSSAATTMPTS